MNTGFFKNDIYSKYWFFSFLIFHLIAWTAIPAFIRDNLPLDAIEGTTWGHQLEWGYDKNPYLNAWLTAAAVRLGGSSGWMIYLFSQLSVITTFFVVFQLGRRFFSSWYALVSVILLETLQYYNFHAIDFNDNTLELGLWALAIYFFYLALRETHQKSLNWILTGICLGFGMMAKYYTASLLTAMFIFLLCNQNQRSLFKTWQPYVGLLAFLMITLPHVVWLFNHDFITVNYVFERTKSTPHWSNHLFYPLQFAWEQIQVWLPAFFLYLTLFFGKKPFLSPGSSTLTQFDRHFLWWIGLGPLLLTLLLSLLFGIKLRAGWGMPLLSLSTLLLFSIAIPRLSATKLYIFLSTMLLFLIVLLSGYAYSLIYSQDPSSANFPGKEIAAKLTSYWHDTYHTPLRYVAGSRWVGGNIAFYSPDHPAVYIEWEKKRSPWISPTDLKNKGAIFVWDLTNDKENLPAKVKQAYPHLTPPVILEFPWHRNIAGLKPVKIGMSVLPPRTDSTG